jgi:SAM-dependent methyltransferase
MSRGALRTVGGLHARLVFPRRVRVLAEHLAAMLPQDASVVDVGCGDGRIDACILAHRPDLKIEGLDVQRRPSACLPVQEFDGRRLPFDDKSRDAVMFVDVLHHTDDPTELLSEASRVARKAVVIKDHFCDSTSARRRLRFMDWVGNRPHGVTLTYNYWSTPQWRGTWRQLGLSVDEQRSALGLYPWPFRWLFETGLHFIVRLTRGY